MNSGTQLPPHHWLADVCVYPSDKAGRCGLRKQTIREVGFLRLISTALLESDLND